MTAGKNQNLDALLPDEMAVRAEEVGVKKAMMSFPALFVLSILAGAFIAFGANLSTVVTSGAEGFLSFGTTRLLGGLVFTLGLILVVVGGAELFTGNNLIVMAWASGRVTSFQILRNWAIVYLGNFVGAFGIALLIFFSGQSLFGRSTVGTRALSIANAKVSLEFWQAVALGILCNVLVCLAVWMSYSGRSAVDKVIAIVPPITAFVAGGFEHSIANMYFIPLGIMLKSSAGGSFLAEAGKTPGDLAELTVRGFLLNNLLPVTAGNIIGGTILVGIVYWFVYLRKRQMAEREVL